MGFFFQDLTVLLSLIYSGNELYRVAPVVMMDLYPIFFFCFLYMYLLSISSKPVMNIMSTYIIQCSHDIEPKTATVVFGDHLISVAHHQHGSAQVNDEILILLKIKNDGFLKKAHVLSLYHDNKQTIDKYKCNNIVFTGV